MPKKHRYIKLGLSNDLAMQLTTSEFSVLFDDVLKKYNKVHPTLIATTLLSTAKDVRRKLGHEEGVFTSDQFYGIFSKLAEDKISKDAIPEILTEVAKGSELAKTLSRFRKLTKSELTKEITALKKKHSSLPQGALIGKAMAELRGKADGKDIIKLLNS